VADRGRALALDAADVDAGSRGTELDEPHEGRRASPIIAWRAIRKWPANMANVTLADEEAAGLWHVMSGDPA
jgi:hypothetical protein